MIIRLLRSLSYSSTILLFFYVLLPNFEITDVKLLIVFVFFLSVFEIFLLPIIKTILYPLNFLLFGQVRRIIVILVFISLINFIHFANITNFYFEGGNFAGIMIPEVSLSKSIFIVIVAFLYDFFKVIVFKEKEE